MKLKTSLAVSFSIVLCLLLSLLQVSADTFKDTSDHWAKDVIETWSGYGIVQGDAGLFSPNRDVTRAEIAAIMDNLMGFQVKAENSFSDLDSSWYTDAILKNVANDVLKGNNGSIRPKDKISRQEFAVVICRSFQIAPLEGKTDFIDDESIDSWAKPYVKALRTKGYIQGLGGNRFGAHETMSRAAVVKLMDNIVENLYNKAGTYNENVSGNLVINTAGVEVSNSTIEGDLILAEGIADGDVKLNNVKVKGRVLARGGGKNSIYFNNVDVNGALVINKKGGEIRIVSEGTTKLSVVTLESGAIIVARNLNGGRIETIEIPASLAKDQKVVLDGSFKKVENKAEGAKLQISGSVESLVLKEKSEVTGDAKIKKIETAIGAESQVNGEKIKEGETKSLVTSESTKKEKDKLANYDSEQAENTGNTGGTAGGTGGTAGGTGGAGGTTGGTDGTGDTGGTTGGDNNNSGSNGSESTETFKVQFDSNGGSEVATITNVKKDSKINRPSDPTKQEGSENLDFLGWYKEASLDNKWNFDQDTVNSNITLYAKWSGFQAATEVDARFADGYPKMSIKEGKLEIAIKLKETPAADQPAEVFVVADNYNHIVAKDKTTSAGVIAGYFGNQGERIYARAYPYLKINNDQEHVIKTNIEIHSERGVGAAVVLKMGDTITQKPIYLEYVGKTASALDNNPPKRSLAFINKEKNKIYLGYHESLDINSVPSKDAFSLSKGSVKKVKLSTNDNLVYFESVVELELEESLTSIDDLTLTYTQPDNNPIKDLAENKAENITNFPVLEATSVIKNVLISNDRKYITFELQQSIIGDLTLSYSYGTGAGEYKTIEIGDYHHSRRNYVNVGEELKILSNFVIELKNAPEKIENGKFFFKLDGDIKSYAFDNIGEILAEGTPQAESEENSTPTACTYNETSGIVITFNKHFPKSDTAFAEHFIVTINEKDHRLRGNAGIFEDKIKIYPEALKHLDGKALVGAKIKFEPIYGDYETKIIYPTGKPLPGFSNIEIK